VATFVTSKFAPFEFAGIKCCKCGWVFIVAFSEALQNRLQFFEEESFGPRSKYCTSQIRIPRQRTTEFELLFRCLFSPKGLVVRDFQIPILVDSFF
jgi:hypothetical protein